MNNEPVAWMDSLGNLTKQNLGDFIPLYIHPVKELILTNEKILEVIKELEHSICFSESLGFFELKEFAEAILRKASEK